jgi:hypothetical protein
LHRTQTIKHTAHGANSRLRLGARGGGHSKAKGSSEQTLRIQTERSSLSGGQGNDRHGWNVSSVSG